MGDAIRQKTTFGESMIPTRVHRLIKNDTKREWCAVLLYNRQERGGRVRRLTAIEVEKSGALSEPRFFDTKKIQPELTQKQRTKPSFPAREEVSVKGGRLEGLLLIFPTRAGATYGRMSHAVDTFTPI